LYAREHGLELDDGLKLEDAGRSAFYGDHLKGVLGIFLKRIEAGEIAPGSVLIVEDLDRLSRQNPWNADEQLSQVIKAGIKVVTSGDGQVYSLEKYQNHMIASLKMFLVHDESKKNDRLKATWKQKRCAGRRL
jgi:DNA invertase Pin-like site-specific DNA recombinase